MKNNAVSPRVIEIPGGKHSLAFTAPTTGNFKVLVRAVGLDFEEYLEIVTTDIGAIDKGAVIISANANDRIKMGVTLNRSSLGAYRLICEEL